MPRILVSGFEPFASVSINPSGDCVASLRAEGVGGPETAWTVLPVTWSGAARVLMARADRIEARGCLMFGVSSGTQCLRVERTAYNLAASRLGDNAGVLLPGEALRRGGPTAMRAEGLDAADLTKAVRRGGGQVELSDDPGRYVCNALYYTMLSAERPWSPYCVFVHVPPVERGADLGPLRDAIRQMVEAYRTVLGATLGETPTEGDRGR